MINEDLSATIRTLYGIVKELEGTYGKWDRHFTLDGHLLGSIGEVYAAERYGIELFKSSEKRHDGKTSDGRLVQIKVTQRKAIALSSEPDYLLVLHVDGEGRFNEVYSGSGEPVWNLVRDKPLPKNGQYQIALSKLERLDVKVEPKDRLSS